MGASGTEDQFLALLLDSNASWVSIKTGRKELLCWLWCTTEHCLCQSKNYIMNSGVFENQYSMVGMVEPWRQNPRFGFEYFPNFVSPRLLFYGELYFTHEGSKVQRGLVICPGLRSWGAQPTTGIRCILIQILTNTQTPLPFLDSWENWRRKEPKQRERKPLIGSFPGVVQWPRL